MKHLILFLSLFSISFSQSDKIDSLYIAKMISKGNGLEKEYKYKEAVAIYKNALVKNRFAKYSNDLSKVRTEVELNFLIAAEYIYYLELFEEGKKYIFQAKKIANENLINDKKLLFKIYCTIGQYYLSQNDYLNHENSYRFALKYSCSNYEKSFIHSALAENFFNRNFSMQSIIFSSLALKSFNENIELTLFNYGIMANNYLRLFNYKKADHLLNMTHNVIIEKKKTINYTNVIMFYINHGYFNNIIGDLANGKKSLMKAIVLLDSGKTDHSINYKYSLAYMNLAVSHWFLGEPDSSLHYNLKALKYGNQISRTNIHPNLHSHRNISSAYIEKKDYQKAYDYTLKILKEYEGESSPLLAMMYFSLIELSTIYPEIDILGNMKKALEMILPDYKRGKDGFMPKINFNLLNDQIYSLYRYVQHALYHKVLNERTMNQKLISFTKDFSEYYLQYLKTYKETYPNSYFGTYFNEPYERSLFRYMNYQFADKEILEEGERLNRALNASLMLYNFKISHKLLTGETLETDALQDKVHRLREFKDMLEYYKNSPNAENKEENIFRYSEKIDSLLAVIRNESPLLENFQKEFDLKDPKDLSKHLNDDEAILLSMNLDSTLFHILIRKDKNIALKTPLKSDILKDDIRNYLASINTLEASDRQSKKLYNNLFSALRKYLGNIKKLYLLPYTDLAQIPYESLSYQDRDGKERYLIEDYELSYHLSLPLLKKSLEKREKLSLEKLLALAPVFKKKNSVKKSRIDERTYELLRSQTMDLDSNLLELKASEEEVEEISELFDDYGYQVNILLNEEADEAALREKSPDHDVLHLATHSVSNLKDPSQSRIFLSYKNKSDYKNDGILSFEEIQNMKLNAALLVLSSCESGVGKTIRGEGNLTLSSAFYGSGAKNIVYSLWKVFDQQTKDFMISFYDKLLREKSVSKALRETKLDYIKKNQFKKFWAGFLHLGVN